LLVIRSVISLTICKCETLPGHFGGNLKGYAVAGTGAAGKDSGASRPAASR
jgi:hypothetical protein